MPTVDRISSLPEGVICHILSFLPTKSAVATSILSKRWYPLWRSVPILDLSHEGHHDDDEIDHSDDEVIERLRVRVCNLVSYLKFSDFVSSCFLMRDARQPIKKFRLISLYNHSNVNKWMSIVLQRSGELEYLELKLDLFQRIFHPIVPIAILSCKALVVLKLCGFRLNDVSSVQLPSLKILHLEDIYFAQDQCLMELLHGCPNLEDFKGTYMSVDSVIENYQREFKSLSKLIRAEIADNNITFPLKALYNIQYLKLFLYNDYNDRMFPEYNPVPAFYNLTHIKLCFDMHYRWQWLLEVLQCCPKLQILQVGDEARRPTVDKNWVFPEFVPECVSSHLTECTICNYRGMEGELRFARYIIRKARVLRTMRIYNDSESDSSAMLKVKKKLSFCQKHSGTSCQLLFHP